MDSAEAARRLLYERSAESIGPEAAAVLMDHLPPAGWADLARRSDVEELAASLRGELAVFRAESEAEFAAARQEMTTGLAAVREEIATLRVEMVAALGRQNTWLATTFASLFAVMVGSIATIVLTLR